MYIIDDIIYALATELKGVPLERKWFDLTGPEKTDELLEEARFLAKHDPGGYVEREFYKRQEPLYQEVHMDFEKAIYNLAVNEPKRFFGSDVWRKATIIKALGDDAELKLRNLIYEATHSLIRQDPMSALMEFKIHHYKQFKMFYEALYMALLRDPNKVGFAPENKVVRKEFERLKDEIVKQL